MLLFVCAGQRKWTHFDKNNINRSRAALRKPNLNSKRCRTTDYDAAFFQQLAKSQATVFYLLAIRAIKRSSAAHHGLQCPCPV